MQDKKQELEDSKFLNELEQKQLEIYDMTLESFKQEDDCLNAHASRVGLQEEVLKLKIDHLQIDRMQIVKRRENLRARRDIFSKAREDFGNSVKERLKLKDVQFSYNPDTFEITSE